MLYVSHSLDEIQHLADNVLVLEEGKVKAFGCLEEVWSSSVMHPWLPQEQQSTIDPERDRCRSASAVCHDRAGAGGSADMG